MYIHLSPQVKTETRQEVLFTFHCLAIYLLDLVLRLREQDSVPEELKIPGKQMTYAKFKPTLCGFKIQH